MWRAVFFAVGSMLIIMGLECLVVERFVVQKARIPAVVANFLDDSSSKGGGGTLAPNNSLARSGYQSSSQPAQSSFGPSRFDDNFSIQRQPNNNFYGGTPSSNSNFSLAGFGKQPNSIAPLNQPSLQVGGKPYALNGRNQARIIRPKDWMPWSLLAAGTLVVLYTNTTSSRKFSDD